MALHKKLIQTTCLSKEGSHHYVLPPAHEAVKNRFIGVCKRCGEESHPMLASQPHTEHPSILSVNSNKPLRRIL